MVLFRARDLDAPAKKRARCFDWQRPGIREAYELSVVSLVASGVAVIMGAVSTGQTDSATALGYTLENCVDFLGSVLVLWRFSGGGDGVPKDVLDRREKRADAGISAMFVVLAVVVCVDAGRELALHERDRDIVELIVLYTPSTVLFVALGGAKLHVGMAIKSPALRKDGMCSLAGALMSTGVLASAVIEETTDIWWVDCMVAILVAAALGAKGASTLWRTAEAGTAWWTWAFWCGMCAKSVDCAPDDDDAPLLGSGAL